MGSDKLSNFTCVFQGVRPFLWYQGQGQISGSHKEKVK